MEVHWSALASHATAAMRTHGVRRTTTHAAEGHAAIHAHVVGHAPFAHAGSRHPSHSGLPRHPHTHPLRARRFKSRNEQGQNQSHFQAVLKHRFTSCAWVRSDEPSHRTRQTGARTIFECSQLKRGEVIDDRTILAPMSCEPITRPQSVPRGPDQIVTDNNPQLIGGQMAAPSAFPSSTRFKRLFENSWPSGRTEDGSPLASRP
jgi:hypothetical protein